MYQDDIDKYNFLSINLFILPIIVSIYLKCKIFLIQSCLVLTSGFAYHIFLRKYKKLTPLLKFLRCLDMIIVHYVTFYIFNYSTYFNIYTLISINCLIGLFLFYYIFSQKFCHSYIHILGSLATVNAIKSCEINIETCHMC